MLTTTLFHYRQPILADEVQTFKALITVHKVLQEGHPVAVKEAQANINWLESLTRGVTGEGLRGMDPYCVRESLRASSYGGEGFEFGNKVLMVGIGYGPLLRDYVYFLLAKLAFHRQHPEFNGLYSLPSVHIIRAEEHCSCRTF